MTKTLIVQTWNLAAINSPELFHFWKCFYPRPKKQLPKHGANLESFDARLVFMKVMYWQSRVKSSEAHYTWWKSDVKRSYEPFYYSLGWTICRKRETSRVHGLSSDRAGRSSELLSVLSTRSYFTPAMVAWKNILVQLRKATFVKTTV